MRDPVKRGYRSELRTAQADATRRSIVAAAARLFVDDGYGTTTVDAVASAAGVSRKTVFTAVGGKLDLLKTALDWAVAGDDQPRALADRSPLRRLLDENDPGPLLAKWAHVLVQIDVRVAPLFRALTVAAGLDPEAGRLAHESANQRLLDARRIVKRLADLGALRPGLARSDAVDIAWLATDPALFDRLVHTRGWPVARFERWLADMLVSQLVGP